MGLENKIRDSNLLLSKQVDMYYLHKETGRIIYAYTPSNIIKSDNDIFCSYVSAFVGFPNSILSEKGGSDIDLIKSGNISWDLIDGKKLSIRYHSEDKYISFTMFYDLGSLEETTCLAFDKLNGEIIEKIKNEYFNELKEVVEKGNTDALQKVVKIEDIIEKIVEEKNIMYSAYLSQIVNSCIACQVSPVNYFVTLLKKLQKGKNEKNEEVRNALIGLLNKPFPINPKLKSPTLPEYVKDFKDIVMFHNNQSPSTWDLYDVPIIN